MLVKVMYKLWKKKLKMIPNNLRLRGLEILNIY